MRSSRLVYARRGLFVLATAIGLVAACSGSDAETGSTASSSTSSTSSSSSGICTPDLASIQEHVFLPSCAQAGCHGAEEPAAFLDLSGSDVAAKLVDVPAATCDGLRVSSGVLEASVLYDKIAAPSPACGDPMPLGGALSSELIDCVRQWIEGLSPVGSGGGGAGGGQGCETCGGSECVDLQADPTHCGDCPIACPSGAGCVAGECACGGGLAECGDACVDTQLDASHCGDCVTTCPTGALCNAGDCACTGALTVCSATCVDTTSDPAHCGGCNKPCPSGKFCNQGSCSVTCGSLTKCGASCVDTDVSAAHCGACDQPCPAGASCVSESCLCPAGTSACGGSCINTTTDPTNCGGCNAMCDLGTTCVASTCVCPGGGIVCGAGCVDVQTDDANCGACGNVCALGQSCVAGSCTCGAASVSFSAAVQPIFTASCALNGCHKGVMPQQALNLSAGKAYASLFVAASQCNDGRQRVLPGKPSESYLIDKMMNVDLCSGTQMPKLGLLPSAEVQTVVDWICAGAPNN